MSVKRSVRSRSLWLICGALAGLSCLSLAGCGGGAKERPGEVYTPVNVKDLGRADVGGGKALLEIDAPKFEFVKDNTAVLRDGNSRLFFAGKDLEKLSKEFEGKKLGLKRMTTPTPYFRVQKVGKTYLDTTFAVVVPRIMQLTQEEVQTPGADLPNIDWQKLEEARGFLPKKPGEPLIPVQTMITTFKRAPRPDNPNEMAWYARFFKSTLEIVDVDPGAEWAFDALNAKRLSMQGSFTLVSLEDNPARLSAQNGDLGHIVGKVRVNWFRFSPATAIKGTK
jgi:hypothetical protein